MTKKILHAHADVGKLGIVDSIKTLTYQLKDDESGRFRACIFATVLTYYLKDGKDG
jgi:hypothetical protein